MTCLVMTLLVRDEADIVRDNIEFHLNHGVDFIVATDNGSTDGTRDTLSEFERLGLVHLLDEPAQDFSQWRWVTRMALMARDRFRADWILNNDADEFWYPASGDLKTELRDSSPNMVICQRRNMLFPLDRNDPSSWQADLIYHVARPKPMPDLPNRLTASLPCPFFYLDLRSKALCRAEGLLSVIQGNHRGIYETQSYMDSENILIYHFPVRSREQFLRKVEQGGTSYERQTELPPSSAWHWKRWYRMAKDGDCEGPLREAVPTNERIRNDLRSGEVTVDRRMQEAFDNRFSRLPQGSFQEEKDCDTTVPDPAIIDALSCFLLTYLDHSSVIHFGCGVGASLSAIQGHGKRVFGVGLRDEAQAAILDQVEPIWICRDLHLPVFVGRADLVTCFDPGNCIEREHADTLADTLVRASARHLVFGGVGAVQQIPPRSEGEGSDSWCQKFDIRGFDVDNRLTAMLHAALAEASGRSERLQVFPAVFTRRR